MWVSSEGKLLVTTWAGDFALPTFATKHTFPEIVPRYAAWPDKCLTLPADRSVNQKPGNEGPVFVTIKSGRDSRVLFPGSATGRHAGWVCRHWRDEVKVEI